MPKNRSAIHIFLLWKYTYMYDYNYKNDLCNTYFQKSKSGNDKIFLVA